MTTTLKRDKNARIILEFPLENSMTSMSLLDLETILTGHFKHCHSFTRIKEIIWGVEEKE